MVLSQREICGRGNHFLLDINEDADIIYVGKRGMRMCIYLGNTANLTYETQEHVLPASWGCCTKLEKGVVSDQANTFFSPIERNIIEKSLLQIPKVIMGPGK